MLSHFVLLAQACVTVALILEIVATTVTEMSNRHTIYRIQNRLVKRSYAESKCFCDIVGGILLSTMKMSQQLLDHKVASFHWEQGSCVLLPKYIPKQQRNHKILRFVSKRWRHEQELEKTFKGTIVICIYGTKLSLNPQQSPKYIGSKSWSHEYPCATSAMTCPCMNTLSTFRYRWKIYIRL